MFLPSNITLQFGDSGDFVSELQRRLAMVDCHPEDQVNGFYDGVTVNSVTRFQSMNGIRADGVAGPETLRLLNGTVSGSAGSSDKKEEEEAKAAQHTAMVDNFALAEAQLATDPSLLSPDGTTHAGDAAPSLIAEAQPYQPERAPESPQPKPISVTEQMIREDAVQEQSQQRQLTTHELLMAQLQRTAEHFTPPQPAQEMQSHAHMRDPIPQPAPVLPKEHEAPLQDEAKTQAQTGLVSKTIRFTNTMLQKIADYMEAKLPPSVLRDVQETGQVMANRGVRETAIPTGPELATPEQLPARGPEQKSQSIG